MGTSDPVMYDNLGGAHQARADHPSTPGNLGHDPLGAAGGLGDRLMLMRIEPLPLRVDTHETGGSGGREGLLQEHHEPIMQFWFIAMGAQGAVAAVDDIKDRPHESLNVDLRSIVRMERDMPVGRGDVRTWSHTCEYWRSHTTSPLFPTVR